MNRRRFLQILGVVAAGPAVVAKLAHHERHPAAPPAPPVEIVKTHRKVRPVCTKWTTSITPNGRVTDLFHLSDGTIVETVGLTVVVSDMRYAALCGGEFPSLEALYDFNRHPGGYIVSHDLNWIGSQG